MCICVQYSAEANKQLEECEQAKHLGAVDVSLRRVLSFKEIYTDKINAFIRVNIRVHAAVNVLQCKVPYSGQNI